MKKLLNWKNVVEYDKFDIFSPRKHFSNIKISILNFDTPCHTVHVELPFNRNPFSETCDPTGEKTTGSHAWEKNSSLCEVQGKGRSRQKPAGTSIKTRKANKDTEATKAANFRKSCEKKVESLSTPKVTSRSAKYPLRSEQYNPFEDKLSLLNFQSFRCI